MVDRANITFKPAFKARYAELTDWETFRDYSLRFLRRSLRVNTLKTEVGALIERLESKGWHLDPIPWCPEGYWVEHATGRRDLGATLEHQLGYFYIQEAASMLPPLALDVQPGQIVLDLCASPGSKSSQIASLLAGKGLLIANDYKGERLTALGTNLQRCGIMNVVITLMRGEQFKRLEGFDRVLVDAPCSGTGTIRKSLKTIEMWNPHMVRKLAGQQLRLLEAGYQSCNPGGIVVYSTCSLEPEENEGVVSGFLERHPEARVEPIRLPLSHGPAVTNFDGKDYSAAQDTIRLWPQDNDTEGFYIAKIRKP